MDTLERRHVTKVIKVFTAFRILILIATQKGRGDRKHLSKWPAKDTAHNSQFLVELKIQ